MAERELPSPRVVVAALTLGAATFVGMAFTLGPLAGTRPPQGLVPVLAGLGVLLPLVGLAVGGRLRPADAALPLPHEQAARAQAHLRALIVQAALAEAGALACGVGLLLAGREPALLGALSVPLSGLALCWARASESRA